MSSRPSVATQVVYATVSTLVALPVAEAIVRYADRGALPQLDCYVDVPSGDSDTILLAPRCARTLARPTGGTWALETDDDGLRVLPRGPAGPPWVVAGDSQVLGMNVDADATFVAGLRASGVPALPVGVPGHGVADALDHARRHLDGAEGVLLVVNGANDWTEAGLPVGERYRAAGGWLLAPDAIDSLAGRFFASALAGSHLLSYAVVLAAHDWSDDPRHRRWSAGPWGLAPDARAAATVTLAREIHAFLADNPIVPLRVAILPADFACTEARARAVLAEAALAEAPWADPAPWNDLRAALVDVPVLDLLPVLRDPTDFLEGDYHLSAAGHAKMTRALVNWLSAP